MLRHSLLLLAVAVAAPGCKLAAGLGLGDKSPGSITNAAKSPTSATSAAEVPKVEADADDPVAVKNMITYLDELEGAIYGNSLARFAYQSHQLGLRLFYPDSSDELADSPKLDKLRERFIAINKRLATMGGGHAVKLLGDGVPPKEAPGEMELAERAVKACEAAAATSLTGVEHTRDKLATAEADYDKAFARAKKGAPEALRYLAPEIAVCEYGIADLHAYLDDSYVPEEPKGGTLTACGQKTFLVRAVQTGGNRFGSYEYVLGSASFPEKVACKKVKRKSRFPKKYAAGVKTFLTREDAVGKGAVVPSGKPYTEVDESDLHVYKYVPLAYTTKKMTFAANPCGGKDETVACEASGSKTAAALNQIEFAIERADVHRVAGRAPKCKAFLESAYKMSESWKEFAAEEKKYKRWKTGLTYKSKAGDLLSDSEIEARIAKLGASADERSIGDYCSNPETRVSKADAKGARSKKGE